MLWGRNRMSQSTSMLNQKLRVVNIGLATFAEDLRAQGADVVHVEWRPPAGGDEEMLKLLERLGS